MLVAAATSRRAGLIVLDRPSRAIRQSASAKAPVAAAQHQRRVGVERIVRRIRIPASRNAMVLAESPRDTHGFAAKLADRDGADI